MKKNNLFLYLLAFSLVISFAGCKKESSSGDNNDIAIHSDDQSRFESETDAATNEALFSLESSTTFSGRLQGVQGIEGLGCDASIVLNVNSDPRTITITYDGSSCLGYRTRTGVVVISMAQNVQWTNAGAAVTVTFQNLKITRVSDHKSITINGSQTYTNVTGGLVKNLATAGPITHTITSSGLSVTFDNGSQRTWQVAKQRTFTFNNGIVITGTGIHTDGNVTGIAEWGTNRFGTAFTTSVLEPLVLRQDCDFRLTSGMVKHTTTGATATATFGLNANGEPTSCPGTGHYYCKAVWTGPNGNSLSLIFAY